MGEWRYCSVYSSSQHWIEISDKTHTSTALSASRGPPVTVGLQAECVPPWSGRFAEGNNCCPCQKSNPDSPLVDDTHCSIDWLIETCLGWTNQGQLDEWNATGRQPKQANKRYDGDPEGLIWLLLRQVGDAWFQFISSHRVPWVGIIVFSPHLSQASAGIMSKLGHKCFLQYSFQINICHSGIRHYVAWATIGLIRVNAKWEIPL